MKNYGINPEYGWERKLDHFTIRKTGVNHLNRKWLLLLLLILVIPSLYLAVIHYGYQSKSEAVKSVINKEAEELNTRNYQSIPVAKSPYTLAITDAPHKIYVFKITKHFNRYRAVLSHVNNLYESTTKESMVYNNNMLEFGFDSEKPRNKGIWIEGQKMKMLPLSPYFKHSRYAWNYHNLSFYYPEHPFRSTASQPVYH
ncbi:hypothetical protein [Fictibacillus fluitans]|uniref:DUF4367 domain-containing protein n=1 Tax=Fictibacillus fluitans TaxID=3058422 RepID=A0ABT8HV51_9BACL|nr:hypothetical protein [Fictibacillus sp. NE201]MDN4524650.1 hypothetical protein [Fictibacillus sp. NE201]